MFGPKPTSWTFPLDERATSMSIVRTSESVAPIFATPDSINEMMSALPASNSTPDEVAALLDIARKLLATSVVQYEFAAMAAEKSLQAVELAVRLRFDSSSEQFAGLIRRLKSTGEFDSQTIDMLDTGRELRNMFAHPRTVLAFPLIMVVDVISTSHFLVIKLYPATESEGLAPSQAPDDSGSI